MENSVFTKIVKLAKEANVKTIDDLDRFVNYDLEESLSSQITGSDFEFIKDKLKIKRF